MDEDATRTELERRYQSITADVARAWDAYTKGEEHDGQDAGDYLTELPYSRTVEHVVTILLEGGGPTAYVKVTCDSGKDATSAEYVANWGGTEVRHRLNLEDGGLGSYAGEEAERRLESL